MTAVVAIPNVGLGLSGSRLYFHMVHPQPPFTALVCECSLMSVLLIFHLSELSQSHCVQISDFLLVMSRRGRFTKCILAPSSTLQHGKLGSLYSDTKMYGILAEVI